MTAYYNEFDRYAAKWLRNLIAAGHIAPGDVDERSIEDVRPADLVGYRQCHFFAGIGVWSYALRAAGWPDDREVWTGSCPCQPFSAAGEGEGFDDERHLWPHFFHLIEQRKPAVVLGEQVASKNADPWIDLVCADMEAMGYAFGAVPFPAAGVGAPHIRDRLYWLAHAERRRLEAIEQCGALARAARGEGGAGNQPAHASGHRRGFGGLGDTHDPRLEGLGSGHQAARGRIGAAGPATAASESGRMADATSERRDGRQDPAGSNGRHRAEAGGAAHRMAHADGWNPGAEREQRSGEQRQQPQDGGVVQLAAAGPVNGLWRDVDWLLCRDGKWRPVEPGTFPLAHGAPARVGRLRAYGNAINAEAARIFVECVSELITP